MAYANQQILTSPESILLLLAVTNGIVVADAADNTACISLAWEKTPNSSAELRFFQTDFKVVTDLYRQGLLSVASENLSKAGYRLTHEGRGVVLGYFCQEKAVNEIPGSGDDVVINFPPRAT